MKNIIQIKEEDYFKYIKTFKIWLQIKKKKRLEDLDKSKVKKKFKKFVKKWNKNKLKDIYYNQDELVKKYGEKIQHNWNFKDQEQIQNDDQIQIQQEIKRNPDQNYLEHLESQKFKKGPTLPTLEDKQKIALSKQEEQKNLMLMHDVEADNTYKWGDFTQSRENRRFLIKQKQQQEYNQKLLLNKQKEDEKLKSILETVNLAKKFQKQ